MGWSYSAYFRDEKYIKILVRKPERKRALGKLRHRWEDMRMDLKETSWECAEWICLAKDRDQWRALVNTVMNFQVP
jgi:hypothetical protein